MGVSTVITAVLASAPFTFALPAPQELTLPVLGPSNSAFPNTTIGAGNASAPLDSELPTGGLSWLTLAVDSKISSSKGEFSIESRLTEFRGCDTNQTKLAKQAFVDALKIVGAVGNPDDILGSKGQEVYEYWGPMSNWNEPEPKKRLIGNFKRAQLANQQTWFGDWWYDRYFQITCDDPLKRCGFGFGGYEDDANTPENSGKYPRINLCVSSYGFFQLSTLEQQIQHWKDSKQSLADIEGLKCQGSAMLHEMMHSAASTEEGGGNAGISMPKIKDVEPFGKDDKAYGAAKSKWLAQSRDLRKFVFVNDDNYVYYALTRFAMETLQIPYPSLPEAAWSGKSVREDLKCVDPAARPGAYISVTSMENSAISFCDTEINDREPGSFSKAYKENSYEEVRITLLSERKMSGEICKDRLRRIIHGCAPASNNPMNWKYGGELDRDDSRFKIEITGRAMTRNHSNGAPLQAPIAKCMSFYQGIRDEFWIDGAGFMDGSWGSELFEQMKHCIGSPPSDWAFVYNEKPDENGMEWKAFGHTYLAKELFLSRHQGYRWT